MHKHYLVAMRWAGCDLSGLQMKNNTQEKKGGVSRHLIHRANHGQVCLFGNGADVYPKVEITRCGSSFAHTELVMMFASTAQTSLKHSEVLYTESS